MPAIDLTPYNEPQGSTSDGTKYDNGLALIQSTINALDDANIAPAAAIAYTKLALAGKIVNADVAAAAAIALSKLGGYPADGTKFAAGDGTWKVPVAAGSSEVVNADLATFTNITATSEATAQTFATATFTADGSTAYVLDAQWYATKGTTFINFALYLDGTDQGFIDTPSASTVAGTRSFRWARRLVPASGSRTFTIRAWVDAGTGTAGGGGGGAGICLPGFFRVAKA